MLPHNEHYVNRYIDLIKRAKDIDQNSSVMHKHHILPRSLFPEFCDDPTNIITISPRLHLILHWVLHHAIGGKMTFAYYQMTIHPQYNIRVTPKQFQKIKERFSLEMSNRIWCLVDGKIKRLNPNDPLLKDKSIIIDDLTPYRTRGYLSPKHTNKVSVFDVVENTNKKVKISEIDYVRYIPNGMLRNLESRDKTRQSLSNRVHCFNPITQERRFIRNSESLPKGFVFGTSDNTRNRLSLKLKGKNHYYNPKTGECKRFRDSEVPSGWVLGRQNFENVFSNTSVRTNIKTKDTILVDSNSPYKRYYVPASASYLYLLLDEEIVKVFPSLDILEQNLPETIKGLKIKNRLYSNKEKTPFTRGNLKGKSLYDMGIRRVKIEDFDLDSDFYWIGE